MITVEPATADDVDALVGLESSLFVEDAGVHDPHADTSWPQREGRKDFEHLLASADALVLVAKRNRDPVGLLVGYAAHSSPTRQPVEYAILRSLYVGSDARRTGVARQLTELFVEWCRNRGCVEVQVSHYAANAGAAVFYEGLGFETLSVSRTLTL